MTEKNDQWYFWNKFRDPAMSFHQSEKQIILLKLYVLCCKGIPQIYIYIYFLNLNLYLITNNYQIDKAT